MKKLMALAIIIGLTACGGGTNSDGSSKSTYTSCSITNSKALLASDRATDVSQCWDDVDFKNKSLARDWCTKKVNAYMGKYIFGHDIEFMVSSTNCPPGFDSNPAPVEPAPAEPTLPSEPSQKKYTINITSTVAKNKKNGSDWDAFGGSPDIKAELSINDKRFDFSETKNSFSYRQTIDKIPLNGGDSIKIILLDLDIANHDLIGAFSFNYNKSQNSYSFKSDIVSGNLEFIIE